MKNIAILLVFGCLWSAPAIAGSEDAYDKTLDAKKIAWMNQGMEAVKTKLKDPDSAEFRNVYFHRGSEDIPMTCGEVNSKNSFGGYLSPVFSIPPTKSPWWEREAPLTKELLSPSP